MTMKGEPGQWCCDGLRNEAMTIRAEAIEAMSRDSMTSKANLDGYESRLKLACVKIGALP